MRHCEVKVSCPRTQHNVLGQSLETEPLYSEASALTMRPLGLYSPGNSQPKINRVGKYPIGYTSANEYMKDDISKLRRKI